MPTRSSVDIDTLSPLGVEAKINTADANGHTMANDEKVVLIAWTTDTQAGRTLTLQVKKTTGEAGEIAFADSTIAMDVAGASVVYVAAGPFSQDVYSSVLDFDFDDPSDTYFMAVRRP